MASTREKKERRDNYKGSLLGNGEGDNHKGILLGNGKSKKSDAVLTTLWEEGMGERSGRKAREVSSITAKEKALGGEAWEKYVCHPLMQ